MINVEEIRNFFDITEWEDGTKCINLSLEDSLSYKLSECPYAIWTKNNQQYYTAANLLLQGIAITGDYLRAFEIVSDALLNKC